MEPELFIAALWGQGFEVNLGPEDSIVVTPGSRLHETQREALRANKPAIVAYLQANPPAGDGLMAMAMQVCDRYGDGEQAREDMRADVLATPPHLRADLLAHFEQTYGTLA
jgi:hypothetical protein